MSVIKAKRKESPVQFITNAKRLNQILHDRLDKYMKKFINSSLETKKYRHLAKSKNYPLWKQPVFNSMVVLSSVEYANLIRIKDKVSYQKRLNHLQTAKDNLKLLKESMEELYRIYRKFIKDKFILQLASLIEDEDKLIDGVINKDKKVYTEILQNSHT